MPVDNTEPVSVYRAGPGYAKCLSDMMLASSRGHLLHGFIDAVLGLAEADCVRLLKQLCLHPEQAGGRIDNTFVALVDGVCAGTATLSQTLAAHGRQAAGEPNGAALAGWPGALRASGALFSEAALVQAGGRCGLGLDWAGQALARQEALGESLAACGWSQAPGLWRLEYLATRRENRGGGVAASLMDRVLAELAARRATALEAACLEGNAHALRLFARYGFALAGQCGLPPALGLAGQALLRLRLELS